MALSMGHYLDNMASLTNQWDKYNYKESDRQRVYLKDIDCPQIWHEKLKEQMPPSVFYLNDSTGDVGGPGSTDERSRGAARAGDLMSSLPPAMRAENLMCYIGHEGTYTPAHREMCASLGQNLMVETSGGRYENGKPTKPGSSIWFMTETKDRHLVSEYWLSTLGHDIEIENHFAQINAWKAAPFNTYIVEQKAGDFILIPPLAPHQVWNRGTRTMKVAWNRTTVETLEMALSEALPRARMVCRDEQYKNKAIVLFTLDKYSKLLARVESQKQTDPDPQVLLELNYSPKIRQLQKDFRRLFTLYTQVLLSELLAPGSEFKGDYIPYDSNITCSFCRCNIFNRFLTCPTCIVPLENGEEDTYDICLECYAMGRSCRCNSNYTWVEQFPWNDLVKKHDHWREQIVTIEGGPNEKSPKSLVAERKGMNKKTLAQVCEEQLRSRPWLDPKKPPPVPLSTLARGVPCLTEDDINDDGTPKKRKKTTRKKDIVNKYTSCHVCLWPEYDWKLAYCTNCDRAYCYGSLFRGFDMAPLSVMEDPNWKCPHCLKICSCASCRRVKGAKPYEPTITVLGHDTKKVADPRSWEGLVNYSSSNMKWIKNAGDDQPHDTRRLHRRRREADIEKSKDATLDEDNYVNEEESLPTSPGHVEPRPVVNAEGDIPIDPRLFAEDAADTRRPRNRHAEVIQAVGSQNGSATPASSGSDNLESRLRHELQDFNEQFDQPTSRLPAPTAKMIEEHIQDGKVVSTDVNGITFEYPEPTLQNTPDLNAQIQPTAIPHANIAEANGVTHNILQSDLNNDVAEKQRKQTMQQQAMLNASTTANSQKNGPGKSLLLRLRIDGSKLATIQPRINGASQGLPKPTPTRPAPQKEILRSDVLDGFKTVGGTVKAPAKRRLTREERDEEFSTRKKPRKASEPEPKTTRMSLPANLGNQTKNYAEDSSDSEIEQPEATGFKAVNSTRKPRALPAYLARRSLGDHEQPLERSSPDPSKRKGRTKASSTTNKHSEPEPPANDIQVHQPRNGHVPARDAAIAALKAMPSSTASNALDDVLSISSSDNAGAIDEFPPDPLPESHSSVDLSKLGPGQADTPMDEAARRAEENRKAKLRALAWAAGDGEDSDDMIDAY